MENRNLIIGAVVIVVLLVGGYFLWQYMNPPADVALQNNQTTTQPTVDDNGTLNGSVDVGVNTPKTYEITLTDAGFAPNDLTVKVGDTVTWKNQSTSPMWVGSAMHPTHTAYSGTTLQQHCPDPDNNDFDECKSVSNGSSWSFTFTKAGSWGYHNHMKANQFGKITVTQ